MSTDSVEKPNRQQFQPIDQWFWPTTNLLSPLMDNNNKTQSVNSSVATSVSSSPANTGAYHRRHKHWWKVCWIYNNGHFIGNPTKPTNFRQFHQQFSSFSMCSSNISAIFNDRCVNRDDQIFSTLSKTKTNINSESEVHSNSSSVPSSEVRYPIEEPSQSQSGLTPEQRKTGQTLQSISMSSCSPQISSSATTSGFLQQKLTQPLTALLKQKCEHKNSISQFFIDFKGSEWRAEQLQYQMPAHDIQMFKSQSNEIKFVRNQQRKAQIKPQLFLNKSLNHCFKCRNPIENDSYGVKISVVKNGNHNNGYNTTTDDEDSGVPKDNPTDSGYPSMNGSTALFHIQCFTCEECEQVLVDLKAFLHTSGDKTDRTKVKNSLYCSRHFVELFKPRCQFCDHLIFDEECTEAEGKAWHLGHFCCTECKRSLGGQQYIMADPSKQSDKKLVNKTRVLPQNKDKQLPYCLTCFDILFGELCEECGELIGCDVGAISHEGRSWHASDHCFKCNLCTKTLLGKPFLPAFDGRIYCSITCSQEAIQRNKYRNRRKQRPIPNGIPDQNLTNNNNSDQKKTVEQIRIGEQHKIGEQLKVEDQLKPKIQIRDNQQIYGQRIADDIGLPLSGYPTNGLPNNPNTIQRSEESHLINKRFSEISFKEKTINPNMRSAETKANYYHSTENNRILGNHQNCEQISANDLINKQMFDYMESHPQLNRPPNHIFNYMRHQLIQNEMNGRNGIIGAAIEYGTSFSEDERTNKQIINNKTHVINDINYNQMISMTSSTSSSLSANPFETNHIYNNSFTAKPSIINSSSSNETTPLLLRSLEERAKQLTQNQIPNKQISDNPNNFEGKSLPSLPSLPKSESPSQTSSQADQSSNSSYVENNIRTNGSIKVTPDLKRSEEVDTPSTQSTALQSTSSQTTPETNPRSANKSVTFDPNVKEPTGRRLNRKPKSRPVKKNEWSDDEWCSTCSSCTSSSSDDNFDYESTLERNRNQWLGGTKIHYVSTDRKKSNTNVINTQNNTQNESCIIS